MHTCRTYDYLTLARQRIFDAVRPLSAEQYTREFPIGLGTLGRTLTHIMVSEWYYVQRLLQREVPAYETWPIRDENPPAFDVLESAWVKQAAEARKAISDMRDGNATVVYRVTEDDGTPIIVTATVADIFTQLVLHEMHHRAQALNMLRHLGIALGDLDFNAMMYQRQKA